MTSLGPYFTAVPCALLLVLGCGISAEHIESHSNTIAADTRASEGTSPPSCQCQTSSAITGISIAFALLGAFSIGSMVVLLKIFKKLNRIENKLSELIDSELDTFLHSGEKEESSPVDLVDFCEQTFNTDFEIERENVAIDRIEILGMGQYSQVFIGVLKMRKEIGSEDKDKNKLEGLTVAVKTLKSDAPLSCFKENLKEINTLCSLGSHEYILTFFGAVTSNLLNLELFAVLEFCPNGDLLRFLKTIKLNLFKNLFKPAKSVTTNQPMATETESTATTPHSETKGNERENGDAIEDEKYENQEIIHSQPQQLSTLDLLEWSRQISSGMTYVSSKNIIHGDVAARNMLLTANNVVKISDFGLSRDLGPASFYILTPENPLPWRLLALETLKEMKFSVASDVWAFGVLLYELFSLGKVPYPGRTWTHDFVDELTDGLRMDSPQWGNEDIYQLMMDCMKKEPSERPSFEDITKKLEEIKIKFCPAEDSDSGTNSNSTQAELNLDN